MPVYRYVCDQCGERFELYQPYTEIPYTRCSICKSDKLHRVYKPVGIIFKGDGFYTTDNKKKVLDKKQ